MLDVIEASIDGLFLFAKASEKFGSVMTFSHWRV